MDIYGVESSGNLFEVKLKKLKKISMEKKITSETEGKRMRSNKVNITGKMSR